MNKSVFTVISFIFLNLAYSEEIPLGVFVGGEDSTTATPSQGMSISSGGGFILRMHTSCFSSNLRGVAKPISPNSMIKAQFDMDISGQNINFFVSFPGEITSKNGMKAASIAPITKNGTIEYTIPGGSRIEICTPTFIITGRRFFGGGRRVINSCITAGFVFNPITGLYTRTVTYPPDSRSEIFVNHNLPDSDYAGIYGNTVQLYLNSKTTALVRNRDGSATTSPTPATLNSYSFTQTVRDCAATSAVYGTVGYSARLPSYACGDYMAKDGPVSAAVSNFRLANDNSSADVNVSFPGQTGFCGGWWSPLMLFMDEKRPLFTGVSDFPLNPDGRTSWVEPNAPGYFLVYDEKMNGIIDSKNQLFGNTDKFKNGFDNLAQFDLNKDNFITRKDKIFKKLFLWNDKNSNGISEKNELIPLEKKVNRISLKYNHGNVKPIGKYAEERESSKFYYIKNKKEISVDIVDVWLAPQPNRRLADIRR